MNKLKTVLIALGLLAPSTQAALANDKNEESYNYRRGVELLLEDDDMDRGLEFLNKEIADHKNNGYAHLWVSRVYHRQEKYGQALESACKAIKYLGKDTEKLSFAYFHRANIYEALGEEEKMLEDLSMAMKYDAENDDAYQMRGDYYYEKQQYDLADADYLKMSELKPGEVYAYMALGRNEMARERYEQAIERFEYVMRLDPDYVYAYPFRAESRMKLKRYAEAMDDVIYTLGKGERDDKAGYVFAMLTDTVPQLVNAKLKAQAKREPNNVLWCCMLALNCQKSRQWQEAIKWCEQAMALEQEPSIGETLKECYEEMGDLQRALQWLNWSIEQDSTRVYSQANRVDLELNMGLDREAWQHVNELIEQVPDYYYGYYRRARMLAAEPEKLDEAIEDYTMAINLRDDVAFVYLYRGLAYRQRGEEELAKADIEHSLEMDSLCENSNCAMYAAFYLGDIDRALALKDSLLQGSNKDRFYDIACLYALMDSTQEALDYLRRDLANGLHNLPHARRDSDLARLRQLPEFEALLKEFEPVDVTGKQTMADDVEYVEELIEIPFVWEGASCMVKCTINGLPLRFCFDTGASDVCLSHTEAAFMLKNNYLEREDFLNKIYFSTANGDIAEGTQVSLREVNFGGLMLKDIKATVTKSQKAPLLLGQTVLQRLGKIEIDNERKVLKVTRMVKK